MSHWLSTGKSNKRTKNQKILYHQYQYSGSSQIPSQDDCNYNPPLSLYEIIKIGDKTELIICDTENQQENVKILDTKWPISEPACITQLLNGDLFVHAVDGAAFMIDTSYKVRILPRGIEYSYSFRIYLDNNIYCFGGHSIPIGSITLSRKFDVNKNRWIKLASLPKFDFRCYSVTFNRNILISGYISRNIWLYSIEIDSFSEISYDFTINKEKILVCAERLYLIQWNEDGLIYESNDAYNWKKISKLRIRPFGKQIYWVYNKEKFIFLYTIIQKWGIFSLI